MRFLKMCRAKYCFIDNVYKLLYNAFASQIYWTNWTRSVQLCAQHMRQFAFVEPLGGAVVRCRLFGLLRCRICLLRGLVHFSLVLFCGGHERNRLALFSRPASAGGIRWRNLHARVILATKSVRRIGDEHRPSFHKQNWQGVKVPEALFRFTPKLGCTLD